MPASRRSLSRNCNRLPRVIDSLVGLRRWLDSHAVAFFDKNLNGVAEMSYARALETLDQLAEFRSRTRDDLLAWFNTRG